MAALLLLTLQYPTGLNIQGLGRLTVGGRIPGSQLFRKGGGQSSICKGQHGAAPPPGG